MNMFKFLRPRGSAPAARERLQILLAHERSTRDQPELLTLLHREILEVIGKHVQLDPDKVQIKMDRGRTVSTLEVDIEIPNTFAAAGLHAA